MANAELVPGTLDLLVLKAVSLGPQHGYGILLRIQQITGNALKIEQGALYPALYKLETRGELNGEWGISENNRRARFYSLTPEGRKRLRNDTGAWERFVAAMSAALSASAKEL